MTERSVAAGRSFMGFSTPDHREDEVPECLLIVASAHLTLSAERVLSRQG